MSEVEKGVEKIYGAQLIINPTPAAPTRACAIFLRLHRICCYKKCTQYRGASKAEVCVE